MSLRALAVLVLLGAGCGIKGPPRAPLSRLAPSPGEVAQASADKSPEGMQPDVPGAGEAPDAGAP